MSAPPAPPRNAAADPGASGFLGRLVARARQDAPLLSRRRPSLFEPRPGQGAAAERIESVALDSSPLPPERTAPTTHARVESAPAVDAAAPAIAALAATPPLAPPAWPSPALLPAPASLPHRSATASTTASTVAPAFAVAHRGSDDGGERPVRAMPLAGPHNASADNDVQRLHREPLPRPQRIERYERVERSETVWRSERSVQAPLAPPQSGPAVAAPRASAQPDRAGQRSSADPVALVAPPRLPSPRASTPLAAVASPGRAIGANPALPASAAPVHVSIGRLEVRAVAPTAAAPAARTAAREPRLALEDYLRQRHGARS